MSRQPLAKWILSNSPWLPQASDQVGASESKRRLGISSLQLAQSRCAASPTAAPSTVVAPIAAGPDNCWRHQSNSDCPSASSRNPHPIEASSHGTPYGPERVASALADLFGAISKYVALRSGPDRRYALSSPAWSILLSVVVVLKPSWVLA